MHRLLLCVLVLALPGCGDESPPQIDADGPAEGWSEPTEDVATPATASDVLGRIRTQVIGGRALSGADWQGSLESLADLLWPPTAGGRDDAVHTHMQLMQVAGDAGRAFARDPQARERWRDRQPLDVQIFEAFVGVSEKGPDAYKAWVGSDGVALLRKKADALQEMFQRK